MRRNFWENSSGNIAVLFGISLLPIMSLLGMAVDYSRATNARSSMQAALDSATLMISKDASGLSAAEISKRAQAYFTAMVNRPELSNITVTAAYTPQSGSSGATLQMSAASQLPTDFMRVAGFPTLDLKVDSTTSWGNTRLRVALALDTTGSMASAGKMPALQTAAKKLVDQLSANAKNQGDLYISLIPFASEVNLGSANYSKTYLDWTGWDALNGNCSKNNGYRSRANCQSINGKWTPNNHSTWNGCIVDRNESYDIAKTAPVISNADTLFQPLQSAYCPAALMPLTYDWTGLKTRIDQMAPSGATNQPIGMAWGWLSLMQTLPLNAPAEDNAYMYKKVLIVLSDGLNTQNKVSGHGSSHSQYVDDRQKLLCDNIKADGLTVYAIQVNTDGDPVSSVLSYCASGSANFYMLTSASQIMSAFDTIGASLAKLRIAK